jgi:hypothetical protein
LYEKVHGKAKARGAHAANEKMGKTNDASDNLSAAFTTELAKKTGQAPRTVRRIAARGKTVNAFPGIDGTSLDKGREIDALAKLPPEKQAGLVEAAQRGEKVSAISKRSACDLETPNTSDDTEEIQLEKVSAISERSACDLEDPKTSDHTEEIQLEKVSAISERSACDLEDLKTSDDTEEIQLEKVSAISERSACDLESPNTSDDTEEIELGKVIARLRNAQPDNPDTMRVCDALESRLQLTPA